jgi:hypothetical protein
MTGTGTIDDPILVGSYEELKEGLNAGQYVKLVNDIDCNDYGANFKWQTIELPGTNIEAKYLDLDGHTIKNVVIPEDNYMFNFTRTSQAGFSVYNGKLLNIFCENASGIFTTASLSTWSDLSISVNATSAKGVLFASLNFERCALYIKSAKSTGIFDGNISDSDIHLEITNLNQAALNGQLKTMSNCRFTGKLGGNCMILSNKGYLFYNSILSGCVFELDCLDIVNTINSFAKTVTSTVINKDLMPETFPTNIGTLCTAEQMRDPDYLNSVGFVVVEVGE